MKQTSKKTFSEFLREKFSSELILLSETEQFISRLPEFETYEKQFKEWRRLLLNQKTSSDTQVSFVMDTIRQEIVALRKELRLQGYDLRLGTQRLEVKGFLNDDALARGYKRVVVCFSDPHVYYLVGSANHVELARELEAELLRKNIHSTTEMHYLWFLRTSEGLFLSGSATEPKDNFIRLQDRAEANPLKILTALKNLS